VVYNLHSDLSGHVSYTTGPGLKPANTPDLRIGNDGYTAGASSKIAGLNVMNTSSGPRVSFTLVATSTLDLAIFNELGSLVYSSSEITANAGENVVPLTLSSNLPSGTYFLRVRAGSAIETRKFTLGF